MLIARSQCVRKHKGGSITPLATIPKKISLTAHDQQLWLNNIMRSPWPRI